MVITTPDRLALWVRAACADTIAERASQDLGRADPSLTAAQIPSRRDAAALAMMATFAAVGLVAGGLASAKAVKAAAFAAFGVAAVAGLVLAATTSWWLLAVGAAAILAAWFYTGGPKPYGYLGLGEVFVFVFFGLVATVGSTYAVCQRITAVAWLASLAAGCLACALLVVNNLRDIPTDRDVGKKTLAVRLGDSMTRKFYVALLALAFVFIVLVAAAGRPWALLGLAGVVVAVPPVKSVLGGASGRGLIPVLGGTGKVQLATGLLAAVGIALR